MMKKRNLFLVVLWVFYGVPAMAQEGSVRGVVKDAKTGETLVGANVLLQGTPRGTITDFDGNFQFTQLSPGNYNLVVSYISYDQQIIRLTVSDNQESHLSVSLSPATMELKSVKVTARRKTDTELSVISAIRASDLIVSGISSQQIGKSQDKDAAEVIRRVPGITINDGRFVIVRGLVERYNSVLLNGSTAPSFEPDVRAFSFDAIPSGMIDNLLIYKSPAPELPADFAGAAINVITKQNADKNELRISYSSGYDPVTTFQDYYYYKGSRTDKLGFDNGTRKVPAIPDSKKMERLYSWPDLETAKARWDTINNISRLFNPNWGTLKKNPFLDQSLSVSYLRRFLLGSVSAGNLTALSYSLTNQYLQTTRAEYKNEKDNNFDFIDDRYQESVKLGVIENLLFTFGNNQKIEFRNFLNQSGFSQTLMREGVNYYNVDTLKATELKYKSRFVYSGQLAGDFSWNHEKSRLDLLLAYSKTNNLEPDLRRYTYVLNAEPSDPNYHKYYLRIQNVPNPYLAGRQYLTTYENVYNASVNYDHKLFAIDGRYVQLKSGFFSELKTRSFHSRLLGIVTPFNTLAFDLHKPVDSLFIPDNFFLPEDFNDAAGFAYRENTNESDRYNVKNNLMAGYLALKIPLGKFSFYGGIRAENFYRKIFGFYKAYPGSDSLDIIMDTLNIFPSLNITYNFNEKNLLRLSYGKTTNRPEFREMTTFAFQDFELFAVVYGNPQLKNSYIQNYDFRYEWYPGMGEIVSIAAFYKKFSNPIEIFLIPAGTGYDYKPFNTKEAYSAGMELDVRKSLAELSEIGNLPAFFRNLSVIFNTSIIRSEINTSQHGFAREKHRIMQGQSPYIVNLGLYYQDSSGLMISLNYNRIGDRLTYVGTPTQPHTWELSRNLLDLTISKVVHKKVGLRLGIKDILNEPLNFVQYFGADESVQRVSKSYLPGTKISAGFVWKF